jgi:hypothetical protein
VITYAVNTFHPIPFVSIGVSLPVAADAWALARACSQLKGRKGAATCVPMCTP